MDTDNTQVTPETANEYLRMVLPLMTKHKIPPTPHNYAIWFQHVSGENAELTAEIERLKKQKKAFTEEVNQDLFSRFASECDINTLETAREEMTDILTDIGRSLISAGADAENYGGHLDNAIGGVKHASSLKDIHSLLEVLVSETKSIQKSTALMNEHFSSKSREIELLHAELQRERKRATTDPLTGLANRVALFDKLNEATAEAIGDQTPAMLMIDIDHFKKVNDTHGHLIGDRVIRYVAQVLDQNIKGRDLAARFGGEEFAILLPNTKLKGAERLAETIRNTIAEAQLVRSDNKAPLGQITVSVGVAKYIQDEDPMEFINRADQALYTSKHNGRNCVTTELDIKNTRVENSSDLDVKQKMMH